MLRNEVCQTNYLAENVPSTMFTQKICYLPNDVKNVPPKDRNKIKNGGGAAMCPTRLGAVQLNQF